MPGNAGKCEKDTSESGNAVGANKQTRKMSDNEDNEVFITGQASIRYCTGIKRKTKSDSSEEDTVGKRLKSVDLSENKTQRRTLRKTTKEATQVAEARRAEEAERLAKNKEKKSKIGLLRERWELSQKSDPKKGVAGGGKGSTQQKPSAKKVNHETSKTNIQNKNSSASQEETNKAAQAEKNPEEVELDLSNTFMGDFYGNPSSQQVYVVNTNTNPSNFSSTEPTPEEPDMGLSKEDRDWIQGLTQTITKKLDDSSAATNKRIDGLGNDIATLKAKTETDTNTINDTLLSIQRRVDQLEKEKASTPTQMETGASPEIKVIKSTRRNHQAMYQPRTYGNEPQKMEDLLDKEGNLIFDDVRGQRSYSQVTRRHELVERFNLPVRPQVAYDKENFSSAELTERNHLKNHIIIFNIKRQNHPEDMSEEDKKLSDTKLAGATLIERVKDYMTDKTRIELEDCLESWRKDRWEKYEHDFKPVQLVIRDAWKLEMLFTTLEARNAWRKCGVQPALTEQQIKVNNGYYEQVDIRNRELAVQEGVENWQALSSRWMVRSRRFIASGYKFKKVQKRFDD